MPESGFVTSIEGAKFCNRINGNCGIAPLAVTESTPETTARIHLAHDCGDLAVRVDSADPALPL